MGTEVNMIINELKIEQDKEERIVILRWYISLHDTKCIKCTTRTKVREDIPQHKSGGLHKHMSTVENEQQHKRSYAEHLPQTRN